MSLYGTDVTKAYIAGIVDGEGSITISKSSKKGSPTMMMKVCVTNTNRPVLEFIQLGYGGSIFCHIRPNKPYVKPCYQLTIACKKALGLLVDIEPFLKIKKFQAQLAIEFQQGRQHRFRSNHLSAEELAVTEAQRIMMSQLNKKGV